MVYYSFAGNSISKIFIGLIDVFVITFEKQDSFCFQCLAGVRYVQAKVKIPS